MMPMTVFGEEDTVVGGACGKEGSNVTWSLDRSTGVMTISGTGAMADFDFHMGHIPGWWNEYREEIKKVIVQDGVTSIGRCAFQGYRGFNYYNSYSNLESVTIADSVTKINEDAFDICGKKFTNIIGGGGIEYIGKGAFSGCSYLESVPLSENL